MEWSRQLIPLISFATNLKLFCLEEHWLYPDELSLISQLNLNFSGFGLSSMCLDDKLITGRPHGGIGILWEQDVREAMRVVFFCTYKTYLYAQNEISYENIQILF